MGNNLDKVIQKPHSDVDVLLIPDVQGGIKGGGECGLLFWPPDIPLPFSKTPVNSTKGYLVYSHTHSICYYDIAKGMI
jgi:hypothetical protein